MILRFVTLMSPCKLQHDAGDQCEKINPRIDFIWKSKMIQSMSRIVPVKLGMCSINITSNTHFLRISQGNDANEMADVY